MVIASRIRLSTSYIQSAYLFAKTSTIVESELKDSPEIRPIGIENVDMDYIVHRSYVLGAIFNSVTFLEATINELFKDIADNDLQHRDIYFRNIEEAATVTLKEKWESDQFDRKVGTLRKYQTFLKLSNSKVFNKKSKPFQEAQTLIDLRNNLIHYKPKWVVHSEEHELEKKLRGKFQENQLSLKEAFFPDGCLGQGCANWAVETSLAFTDEFYNRIQVDNPCHYYLKFIAEVDKRLFPNGS